MFTLAYLCSVTDRTKRVFFPPFFCCFFFFLKGVQLVILKIKRSRGWDGGGNDCDDVRSAGKGWIKTKCEVDQSI